MIFPCTDCVAAVGGGVVGDLAGFPPTLIQVGSHEILRSDATRLRRRMLDAGVLCRLEEWENLWHVFQMFPIKKAEQAMEQAGAFLLDGF